MSERYKDVQEQGADKGKKVISFGVRHPLISLVLIVLAVIAIFIWTLAGSCGMLATAGIGMVAGAGSDGQSLGYEGGSGEDYASATDTQRRIVDSCRMTPAAGPGLCATWVYNVFANAGFIGVGGNANDMWANYCYTNDTSQLEVGMIIAVQHSGPTGDSWEYGHVGVYVGDDTVMHSTGGRVEITALSDWIATFDPYNTVKWGFPPAVKSLVEQEQQEERNRARQIPELYQQKHVGYIWDVAFGNRSDWIRSSPQYKLNQLWKDLGSVSTNNVMTIKGKYMIAAKEKFGDLGDWVTFYFEDGSKIECVMYDHKGNESNATEWGHIEMSGNRDQIKVLEFYMEDPYAGVPFMSTSNRVCGWINHGRCSDVPESCTVWD